MAELKMVVEAGGLFNFKNENGVWVLWLQETWEQVLCLHKDGGIFNKISLRSKSNSANKMAVVRKKISSALNSDSKKGLNKKNWS